MLDIKVNQIIFLNKFNDFMTMNNYNNLFDVGFRTTDDNNMYLSFIEKKSDLSADIIMRKIGVIADECFVDIYLSIVPKDLSSEPVSLFKFRKKQNGAKSKLEKYFLKYGYEILRKEVVNYNIEIEMVRRSK